MRLRLYESVIASRFVFSQKIRGPATFDFYNSIGQNPTPAPQQTARLFNHLVSDGEQGRRHRQAERLGGLEIDRQLELGRLHHRQVARLFALEDAAPSVSKLK
jgi:hypothetical protein